MQGPWGQKGLDVCEEQTKDQLSKWKLGYKCSWRGGQIPYAMGMEALISLLDFIQMKQDLIGGC